MSSSRLYLYVWRSKGVTASQGVSVSPPGPADILTVKRGHLTVFKIDSKATEAEAWMTVRTEQGDVTWDRVPGLVPQFQHFPPGTDIDAKTTGRKQKKTPEPSELKVEKPEAKKPKAKKKRSRKKKETTAIELVTEEVSPEKESISEPEPEVLSKSEDKQPDQSDETMNLDDDDEETVPPEAKKRSSMRNRFTRSQKIANQQETEDELAFDGDDDE